MGRDERGKAVYQPLLKWCRSKFIIPLYPSVYLLDRKPAFTHRPVPLPTFTKEASLYSGQQLTQRLTIDYSAERVKPQPPMLREY